MPPTQNKIYSNLNNSVGKQGTHVNNMKIIGEQKSHKNNENVIDVNMVRSLHHNIGLSENLAAYNRN